MRAQRWCILASLILPSTAAGLITVATQCLLLPPSIRIGLGGEQSLRKDCEIRSGSAHSVWFGEMDRGYQVATALFRTLVDGRTSTTIWFPRFADNNMLEGLVRVVNDNAGRLGGVTAKAQVWPEAPCHGIQLAWSTFLSSECIMAKSSAESVDKAAVKATKAWVSDTLCRLGLCPYTASLSRAAVGLDSVNVRIGPIQIRPPLNFSDCSAASLLAASFWEGVTEIATTPEEVVATSLLIAPYVYDETFVEFAATCDELIEPAVQVVHADQVVGRAWFHPNYSAACVGHETITAGHAIPASMVREFIDKTIPTSDARTLAERPSMESVANANDFVRWTPHATINLLRRSQLVAAKQVEAESSNKKPNHIYARNVMKILADQEQLLL